MDTDTPRTKPTARSRRSYVGPGSTREPARPQVSAELIAALAARLRPRDTWLLELLHEHRVLTTAQICQLAFTSISAATHRMLTLWRLRATERFRPSVPAGSAPLHYVLGPAGAAILADHHGMSTAEFGYRPDHALALASSATLAHLVGSHTLFTALIAHARTHPDAELAEWWSERRCAAMWGKIVRPDGYGTWRQDGHRVSFFTEYDTGTEPLNRLLAKIGDYTALAEMTRITDTPALFVLPNPTRERHLHAHTHPTLPLVATTTPTALEAAGGPAGPAWQLTQATYRRQRLIDLTALTRTTTEAQP